MTDPYQTPAAVESAIRSAAQKAARNDRSLSAQERIRLEYFHRFLCRIFSETPTDAWLLKGGTALLARVASARATSDVDLFNRRHSLAAALTELRRLAALDLGDFFRFEYVSHTDSLGGKQQAYTEGVRVSFDVYLGVNKKGRLNVDLVVKAVVTDTPETIIPSNVLALPKLPQCEYRLYPLVDQIADKVCATLSLYNGYPSTRVKDLVDLVVLTLTQTIDGGSLEVAITREAASRGLPLPETFTVPPDWDAFYRRLASPIPDCKDYLTVALATSLVNALLEPVLARKTKGLRWDPGIRAWV